MSRRHSVVDSPIGELIVVADGTALLTVLFTDPHDKPANIDIGTRDDDGLAAAARQLREYFDGERTEFDLELAPRGRPFEMRVWDLLREIPYGETRTYGDLARELGDPGAAQAVGAANGRNPLAVIVPCHRVIGADGSLTGYAGGLDRKRFLLKLEEPSAAEAGRLF